MINIMMNNTLNMFVISKIIIWIDIFKIFFIKFFQKIYPSLLRYFKLFQRFLPGG